MLSKSGVPRSSVSPCERQRNYGGANVLLAKVAEMMKRNAAEMMKSSARGEVAATRARRVVIPPSAPRWPGHRP
jgi:hypothetical protein